MSENVSKRNSKSNISYEDINLVATALALDQAKEEKASQMSGTIRTKEKCPDCGRPFIVVGNAGMICPKHSRAPKSYFIDVSYEIEGGKKREKIYSTEHSQPLSSYRLSKDTRDEITHRIKNGTFNPGDFKSRMSSEEKGKWHLWVRWRSYANSFKRPNTVESHLQAEKHIFSSFKKEKDFRYFTQQDINSLAKDVEKKSTAGVAKTVCSKLLACINMHRRIDLTGVNLLLPKIEMPKRKKSIPDIADAYKILEYIDAANRDIFTFTMLHADRPSETLVVKAMDFNFATGELLIQRCLVKNEISDETKTGEDDDPIPIHWQFLNYYRQLAAKKMPDEFMFINPRTDKHYTYPQMNEIWRKARKKAGLQTKMYKALKHSGMTERVNKTGNLVGTSGLARHTTTKEAERTYTKPLFDSMTVAQEALKLPESLVPKLSPEEGK